MAGLQVNNPVLQTGEKLYWQYQGFVPNEHVLVFVQGGGGVNTYADELGNGSGNFTLGEGPGDYILIAVGDSGLFAQDPFTVTAPQSAGWKPMLPALVNSGSLSYGLPQPTSSSATIPANAQPGAAVQVVAYIGVGNVPTLVKVTGTYGSTPLSFNPAQSTIQNGTQSFIANFTMPVNDTVVALTFQYWNGATWVTFDQAIATVIVPQSVGWHPMLMAFVTSGQLNYAAQQSVGWHAMLTALVASAQLAYAAPQSMGWFPMLSMIVSSDRLDYSAQQSAGWNPMLTALVATAMLKFSAPQSFGWAPMMTNLTDSGVLKIPGGGGEESGTSPWVWALVAAALGLVAAAGSQKNKPPMGKTPSKALTNAGKMG